ncbi:outer membrane family protein [Helicobacter saguini]|nr:outer membrane family protein [Helicobacter saguini]MWV70667.1 hypothetical protein [Helicobacter saguini]
MEGGFTRQTFKGKQSIETSNQDSITLASLESKNIESNNQDSIKLAANDNEFNYADSYESDGDDRESLKFFTFSGQLSSFVKAGFNQARVDLARGIYPTESFATIFGQFNTHYNFLKFIENDYITRLNINVGASAAGLILDSTLRDGAPFAESGLSSGSGLNNNYIGGWQGFTFDLPGVSYPYKHNRYFVVQDANIDFESKLGDGIVAGHDLILGLKAGRYASSMEYHSGHTQGFNLDLKFGYGDTDENEANYVKIWWFSSWGRALIDPEWLYDYFAPKSTLINGKKIHLGIHALGLDYSYGGVGESDSGERAGSALLIRPFIYFYPGLYESIGLKAVYEDHFGNGFGYKATLQGFFLHVHDEYVGGNNRRYDSVVDAESGNINAILQVFMYNYNARFGLYKNFGSGNSHFGTYGNPMGFDFWTGSVYDIGPSISDVINREAITGYLSGGGSYNLKYGTFSWDILARITRSPRSDEESVALTIKHAFKNNIGLGLKLEWFRDTTKAGYNPGAALGGTPLSAARTDDRSHAFIMFDYLF